MESVGGHLQRRNWKNFSCLFCRKKYNLRAVNSNNHSIMVVRVDGSYTLEKEKVICLNSLAAGQMTFNNYDYFTRFASFYQEV